MSNKIELAQEIIELEIKKVKLLKEMREALTFEQSMYHVVEFADMKKYSLYEIATSKEVFFGNAQQVHAWLQRRKVDYNKVYNFHVLPTIQ